MAEILPLLPKEEKVAKPPDYFILFA